jgi:hypothetical protein
MEEDTNGQQTKSKQTQGGNLHDIEAIKPLCLLSFNLVEV